MYSEASITQVEHQNFAVVSEEKSTQFMQQAAMTNMVKGFLNSYEQRWTVGLIFHGVFDQPSYSVDLVDGGKAILLVGNNILIPIRV